MSKIIPFAPVDDRQRFDALLRPQLPILYRMAYRLTGNRADSEDLLQDLITKLCRKPDQVLALEEPLTWLKRALYNQFVDSYRRARLRPELFSDVGFEGEPDLAETSVSPEAGPRARLEQTQLHTTLMRAVDSLGDNQRALVLLHDVEGMTLGELEHILDEPIGTLKSRLHRARKTLRDLLKDATF